jgi:hypothetical protein
MKTRAWRYLVEFHRHDNTDCPRPVPKPGRGLIKVWGTGDLPLCTECERLSRSQNLEQSAQALRPESDPNPEVPALGEVDDRRDPD